MKPAEAERGDGDESSPLKSNFGKTVLAGLSGLALVSIVEPILKGKDQGDLRLFYVVWFVAWFVLLMLVFAFFKGLTEAVRSRLASEHRSPPWPGPTLEYPFGSLVFYWGRRFWSYLLSWRPTTLTFFDTSLSFFFGRNLLRNAVLGDEIVKLQSSLYRATDRLRQHIADEVRRALQQAGVEIRPHSVRVNVSMLASDRSFLWYIAWAPGSLIRVFGRNSVAWVAVCSGEMRWWRKSYNERADEIILFKNEPRQLDVPDRLLHLANYFEPREPHDYEAFVVLPLPLKTRRRGLGEKYRWGAVHISFAKEEYLGNIWHELAGERLEGPGPLDPYSNRWERLATDGPDNAELRAVLRQATDTLVELLRDFNPTIFDMHIRPRLIP